MAQRRNLKVSYHGNRRTIRYKMGNSCDEILKKIMLHFEIPRHHKSSLLLTTETGKVFSGRQLRNYLQLFPNPHITFYLRYASKGTTKSDDNLSGSCAGTNRKSLKRQRDAIDYDGDDETYPTTPVFRMNCFIGAYPSKCSAPPAKRVRFSEALNRIKVIPARQQLTSKLVAGEGTLRRMNSFVDEYPETATFAQRIVGSSVDQPNRNSTKEAVTGSKTQLALWSPVFRMNSFINTYPTTPQQPITKFFKQKARRTLFTDAQKRMAVAKRLPRL
ncbi:uncharacterized protein LOC118734632 [Rhagoletis pomonella]|uniref:uncharacterized protein LOC118734632 n=1 Tax=Rhagoletis pomonella TaxID=28610 RepID=UPI00177C5A8F|nr:uncharacterized protein LOC118734632 [Rhagoletis pomonella]